MTVRVGGPHPSTSLITKEVAPVKRILCASPAYIKVRGEPTHPNELKAHRCLQYGYNQMGSRWRLHSPDGEHSAVITCVISYIPAGSGFPHVLIPADELGLDFALTAVW